MGGGFFGSYFKRRDREESDHEQPEPAGSGAPGSDQPEPEQPERPAQAAPIFSDRGTPVGPGAAVPSRPPITGEPSPLDAMMQDQVVMALLQEAVISMPQALMALRQQKGQAGTPLWRILAGMQGVDRDAVFSEAARTRGIETAHISEKKPAAELVEAVLGLFPAGTGAEMFRLGILPFEFVLDAAARRHNLVFATHDPENPAVRAFMEKLGVAAEIRYAPASVIADRIRRIRQVTARLDESNRINSTQTAQATRQEEEELAANDVLNDVSNDVTSDAPVLPNGFTFDDIQRLMQVESDEEVLVEGRVDPGKPLTDNDIEIGIGGIQSGSDQEPPRSFDGASRNDDKAPALKLTEWTGDAGDDGTADAGPQDAALEAVKAKDRVVSMLLRKEIVTPDIVIEAQNKLKKERSREALWRSLAANPKVDRDAVYAEAARVYAFPMARLNNGQPDAEFARSVMDTFSEEKREELIRLHVCPFECDLEHQTGAIKLVFITHDPTRNEVHKLMQQLKLERFELRYAPLGMVASALAEAYPKKNEFLERMSSGDRAVDIGTNYDETAGLIDEGALEAEISRSSLINLFEATLVEAVRQGASDIHIYPNADKKIEIHFRVDGRLTLWHLEDKIHPEAFLAVIKDNSVNVDRFERDAAQDGFIQRWIDEALIRFRVSVLPIANASQELRSESIVIRVLDDRKVITDLRRLGLLDSALQRFSSAIHQPHGMVILTGPTGSGKSTTLVAALHQVVTPEVNVLTVEDPVEYIIPGVRQIKLNHKLGLEEALRSILRHDPDVVMVGEMRDRQTAELAIKLANTGHLTFSTLHTNDAAAAVSRLYKMGIEPFLIAYAINMVVAQRLIRTLCPACKTQDDDPDPVMLNKLGFSEDEINNTPFYQPGHDQNCKSCKGTGYKGRKAVVEALYFSRNVRHMIVESDKNIDEASIRDLAVKEGMLTLADSAREIVKMGDTSVMEMIRVVTTES